MCLLRWLPVTMGNSIVYYKPSTLRYTHDSIGTSFSDGHSLEGTFREFLYGNPSELIETMPPLEIMYHKGYWYVVRGNRRLYILKRLEEIGIVSKVRCFKKTFEEDIFERQYTTGNNGTSIAIRGGQTYLMQHNLIDIEKQWRKDKSCAIM